MIDIGQYRASDQEKGRTEDLVRLLPRNLTSALDIGARDGHFSRILREYFAAVTALDLEKPSFAYPGITTVAGHATRLEFPDSYFDCVFCAEVLEHIPELEKACREIARVARSRIVIGVPFQQDTRVGRTTCRTCGKANPPWGHVNEFDEQRILGLFPGLRIVSKSFVGVNRDATNPISALLMDIAGNPWGSYDQDEPCIHCNARLIRPPAQRSLASKVCSAAAARLTGFQAAWTRPHANWIHVVFAKGD